MKNHNLFPHYRVFCSLFDAKSVKEAISQVGYTDASQFTIAKGFEFGTEPDDSVVIGKGSKIPVEKSVAVPRSGGQRITGTVLLEGSICLVGKVPFEGAKRVLIRLLTNYHPPFGDFVWRVDRLSDNQDKLAVFLDVQANPIEAIGTLGVTIYCPVGALISGDYGAIQEAHHDHFAKAYSLEGLDEKIDKDTIRIRKKLMIAASAALTTKDSAMLKSALHGLTLNRGLQ